MMFVELIREPAAIYLSLNIGSRIPMAMSAPGRAYLFAAPEKEREVTLKELARHHGEAWAATFKPALMAAFDRMSKQSHSDSFGEWNPDHNAIGVPLYDPLTGDIYTLSVGGNAALLTPDRLRKEYLPKLLSAAQDIAVLGGGG